MPWRLCVKCVCRTRRGPQSARGLLALPTSRNRISANPNGILSQRPGLRGPRRSAAKAGGTSYPGSLSPNLTNRSAVAAIPLPRARDPGHNAVGVVSRSERAPKVAPTHRGNLGLKDTIPLGFTKCCPGIVGNAKRGLALFPNDASSGAQVNRNSPRSFLPAPRRKSI